MKLSCSDSFEANKKSKKVYSLIWLKQKGPNILLKHEWSTSHFCLLFDELQVFSLMRFPYVVPMHQTKTSSYIHN